MTAAPVEHFVYVVEGPSGSYVGLTTEPEKRWKAHRKCAVGHEFPLYVAMRADGVERYTFKVIATLPSREDGLRAEAALILKLRAEGRRVFNLHPSAKSKPISAETVAQGERLRAMRIARGLNQSQLARALRCMPGAIWRYETGRTSPSAQTMFAMAKVFRVGFEDVFFDPNEQLEAERQPTLLARAMDTMASRVAARSAPTPAGV